jgi:dTDP-4-amino-4,6-dideoxy-D-glucose acyltransferase
MSATGYLSFEEVERLGLASVGHDVQISRDVRFYGTGQIALGSHVRIDDFTVISAGAPVVIGDYVHIHSFCGLYGQAGIVMEDFSGLSGRVSIYSASDDYSGNTMTNPTVPSQFKNVKSAQIRIGRHAIVGTGAVLLPGAELGEGSAIGALVVVRKPVPEWSVYAGNPPTVIKARSRALLELEKQLRESMD